MAGDIVKRYDRGPWHIVAKRTLDPHTYSIIIRRDGAHVWCWTGSAHHLYRVLDDHFYVCRVQMSNSVTSSGADLIYTAKWERAARSLDVALAWFFTGFVEFMRRIDCTIMDGREVAQDV